ncbi:hypothetical protein CHU95_02220 [Niveispirillum lacus]|uniref:DUF6916 domain-containing protein n=1 Tax=Niveispirillum lacus TaxID=1981099 RepID=A0A255Z8F8_9PROT|nr:hypothetical protein [Niveispirillum lacus]OYQ37184.1 hypothetical protein CHU95_02220 [Niveispirillum lacus]
MLTFEQAKPLEGEVLTVVTPAGPFPLTVERVYVRERQVPMPPPFKPVFYIIMRGPPGVVFPQSCYRVEHASFGALDLGVGPIEHDVVTDTYIYSLGIG